MCTLLVARKMWRIQLEYMQNPINCVFAVFVCFHILIADSLTQSCLYLSINALKASLLRTFEN